MVQRKKVQLEGNARHSRQTNTAHKTPPKTSPKLPPLVGGAEQTCYAVFADLCDHALTPHACAGAPESQRPRVPETCPVCFEEVEKPGRPIICCLCNAGAFHGRRRPRRWLCFCLWLQFFFALATVPVCLFVVQVRHAALVHPPTSVVNDKLFGPYGRSSVCAAAHAKRNASCG